MHPQNHMQDPRQGPATGPIRPVSVVIANIDEDDTLPDTKAQLTHDEDLLSAGAFQQDITQRDTEMEPKPRLPLKEPKPLPLPASHPRHSRPRVLPVVGGIGLLLVGIITGMLLSLHPELPSWLLQHLPGLSPTATVTLTPSSAHLSTNIPITAVTGTPDSNKGQVSARLLTTKSTIFTQTVPTTGRGHTDAHQAQGTLTFYNAAPYAQTIASGTVLTTAGNGIGIVTDQAAMLPAGNPPAFGIAVVPAHAVLVGPQGNIAPLSLNGLCCVAGVSVKNTTAFSGGQNARDYAIVALEDVDRLVGPQRPVLLQQAQAALQGQVRPGEQLVSPAQCQTSIKNDHLIGSEASQVTVTVIASCQAEVYDQQAVQQLATTALSQQAQKSLGAGYSMQGTINTSITQIATTEQTHGTLSLLVKAEGMWSYQFSQQEVNRLSRQIAGKARQEAVTLLKRLPSVSKVEISETWGSRSIPTDPSRIQVMVVSPVGK